MCFPLLCQPIKGLSLPRFWHWLIFISKHVVFDEEIFTILDRRLSYSSPLSAHLPGMTSIDYYETFSLVVKSTAIKWMLALLNGISCNWKSPMPFSMECKWNNWRILYTKVSKLCRSINCTTLFTSWNKLLELGLGFYHNSWSWLLGIKDELLIL